MKNLDEKNYVLIGKKVEVSSEFKKEFERMRDNCRTRQYKRGECRCPKSKWFACTTDCIGCEYRMSNTVYIDGICSDDDEDFRDEFIFQQTKNNQTLFEDRFADSEEAKDILKKVQELMPELIEYGKLKLEGYSNSEVAKKFGLKRTTFEARKAKVYAIVEKEFYNFKK